MASGHRELSNNRFAWRDASSGGLARLARTASGWLVVGEKFAAQVDGARKYRLESADWTAVLDPGICVSNRELEGSVCDSNKLGGAQQSQPQAQSGTAAGTGATAESGGQSHQRGAEQGAVRQTNQSQSQPSAKKTAASSGNAKAK